MRNTIEQLDAQLSAIPG